MIDKIKDATNNLDISSAHKIFTKYIDGYKPFEIADSIEIEGEDFSELFEISDSYKGSEKNLPN